MLYITTREKTDAYTVYRVLRESAGKDGGLYLPFRMPHFSAEELGELNNKSFGQCVAEILNLFFSCRMTGWDVEFAIGRHPVKMASVNQRVMAAQLWHNQESSFEKLEKTLTERICPEGVVPPSWVIIATRIAVLFGTYGEMLRAGGTEPKKDFDVALPAEDFAWVMAVWYGRSMGLPIANIICGCYGSSAVWELLHLGEVHTEKLPQETERLVFGTLGTEAAKRFAAISEQAGLYILGAEELEQLRRGLFAAVVSRDRLESAIPSVYRTGGYVLSPNGALAYSALQDHRARTGGSRPAVVLEDKSPLCHGKYVAQALGMTEQELKQKN